jgi:hypothetical protein
LLRKRTIKSVDVSHILESPNERSKAPHLFHFGHMHHMVGAGV